MDSTELAASCTDRRTPVKVRSAPSRGAAPSLWSSTLGPTTPQQGGISSRDSVAVLVEGRGRRRRLGDEYDVCHSSKSTQSVLQPTQSSPKKAVEQPDLFADECLFATPPPVSRKRRSTAASPAEQQYVKPKTAPAFISKATCKSPVSCNPQACQLSFTPVQASEVQPLAETSTGDIALSTPACCCSASTRRSMKFEDLPRPVSPFNTEQTHSQAATEADSALATAAISEDNEEDDEILPCSGLAVHKSASFHDWLDTIVAMVSPPSSTALDDVTAAIDSSSNADADFSLAPIDKPLKRRNPSLLEILAASLEKCKPSKCLGSAWSSEAGEEGLSACEAAALKPVQQHFDKGVANFSDMVAASLQP